VTFDFPDDLVQLQRDWFGADAARTAAARNGDSEAFEAASARLQDLSMALHRHPWMQACDTRYQARMALREAARQAPTADGSRG
jgi:hypothetical protein